MTHAPQGSPLIQGTLNPAPGPRRSRRLLRARIHPTVLAPREALRRPLAQFGFVAALFVAVLGLGGVDEECGSARTGQGGGDFARDVPGFAHPDHDYPSSGGEACPAGLYEGVAEAF